MSAIPHRFQHTWRQTVDCATKTAAVALLAAWKREKEEAGWTVTGSVQSGAVIASAPGANWEEEMRRACAGKPPKLVASAIISPLK